jgi:phage/plasmid-like protein (TIGR03299 family)
MSHEIEVINGQASTFGVLKTPWHGLGKILDNPPTTEEAIKCAGLDWQVSLVPLHGAFNGVPLTGVNHWATVRSTDASVLGVVGPTYVPLQNVDAFKFFQPVLDAGEATLETAGSLRKGRRVWILARVKCDPVEIVPGDPVVSYLLLSNGHDGTMAIRAGSTLTRVVCSNTLSAAHQDGASKLLRIRHTDKASEALEVVRDTMNIVRREFEATTEQFKILARKGVVKADLESYVRKVFFPKVTLVSATEEVEDPAERLLGKIIPLFETGAGNDIPGVRGTAWAALNAVTHYLSHERGQNADNRVNSLWFGDSANTSQRAFTQALKFAAG